MNTESKKQPTYSIEKNDPHLVVLKNERGDTFSFNPESHPGAYDFFVYGIENQSKPSPFWNKYPQTKPTEDKLYLFFFPDHGEIVCEVRGGKIAIPGSIDTTPSHWAEIPLIDFEVKPKSSREELADLMERYGVKINLDTEGEEGILVIFENQKGESIISLEWDWPTCITPEMIRGKAEEK